MMVRIQSATIAMEQDWSQSTMCKHESWAVHVTCGAMTLKCAECGKTLGELLNREEKFTPVPLATKPTAAEVTQAINKLLR